MKILSRAYLLLLFLFLYAPIVVMIVFSFNSTKSWSVWTGFTFDWYIKLFKNKEILKALQNTVFIAIISSIVATIFGTSIAVGISSTKKRFKKKLMKNLTNFPLIMPEIVMGISLMMMFVFINRHTGFLKFGIVTLVLSHITFCLPYVVLSVYPKLKQLDLSLFEAAQDLGCSPIKAFVKVILPEIMPGILSGMVLAFTMSIDDFVVSYFNCGTVQTLPIAIYSMTRKLISPEINALATILFVVILFLSIIVNLNQFKSERKNKKAS